MSPSHLADQIRPMLQGLVASEEQNKKVASRGCLTQTDYQAQTACRAIGNGEIDRTTPQHLAAARDTQSFA